MHTPKSRKRKPLRHAEYYHMQDVFDRLYADAREGKVPSNLLEVIMQPDNILLAFRAIKRNKGNKTPGVDGVTIQDIEKIPEDEFAECIQRKLSWYIPRAVKRVEIPKANGKMRPLGIPSMWDRIVQQCIRQVLEPICEAQFHERSNGFRPNRSAEQAIAQCARMMQVQKLHFVVDIDIKGFFDNVHHSKLRKQMWALGLRDKKLLCIITAMLKAPIVHPDGRTEIPTRGTPQGGILSPLLSNIVLNELDWWIASQWETMPIDSVKPQANPNGSLCRSGENRAMRQTRLKEMYIVRYADDFKIFCRKRSDADKVFAAVTMWLDERLKLQVSEEKSKVVNLKKAYTEFLGFKLKVHRKGGKYVVESHMSDKALEKTKGELVSRIKDIQHSGDKMTEYQAISRYNATVIGKHRYYQIATHIALDFQRIVHATTIVMENRLRNRLKRTGNAGKGYVAKQYGKSRQLRFIGEIPIAPIAYIKTRHPQWMRRGTCNYTPEGRALIHKQLKVDMNILLALMRSETPHWPVEYRDNRISLYAAQYGKCAVSGETLRMDEIHCHHIIPKQFGGDDRYNNLVILHEAVHRLIHASHPAVQEKLLQCVHPTKEQLDQINKFRKMAQLREINA